jgi:tetratricopeptide (TPR) repeat protein
MSAGRTIVAGCCIIALSVVVVGVPAQADVRSHALYARGLIPFNSGQWQQAYRLFDQAVQTDRTDALALYYRGLTQVRLNQTAAAIKDFEQALTLDPSLAHAPLDLGIAYFDTGQFAAAKTWLERAYKQGNERLVCAFFLGVTLYRLGDETAALVFLNEAKADPEVRAAAQYYAGLVLAHRGDTAAARDAFAQVAKDQPQSEIGRAAQQSGVPAEARQPPSAIGRGPQQPWSLYATLGFEYDTNVVIGPSDSAVNAAGTTFKAAGISGEGDGRTVIGAGGGYTLLDADIGTLRASYDFYQSIHFRLTDFDLQGHRLRLDAASHPGLLSYGLSGTYDFYALDYQSFFQEVLGTPWLAVAEGSDAATQLYYTVRARDFFRKPYDPARDAIDHAVGLRQFVVLGDVERVVSFGYQFDSEDSLAHGPVIARDFDYNAHQLDVGLTADLFGLARGQVAYLFRLEDYQFPNSRANYGVRRHDNEHQISVALEHDLTSALALTCDFVGVINNSNIPDFAYDRDIVSVGLRVHF